MSCIMSRKTVLLLLLLIIWIITNFLVAHFCTKNIHIKQGDRIAVVGNGPSVKSEKCGTYIDNHDVVIRFNSAPIIPEYTGEKTSIHVITAGSDKSFIKGAQKVMIMNSSLFKYFRPQFCEDCSIIGTSGDRPTSGLVILRYLTREFPQNEINIIGFDGFDKTKETFSQSHYFSSKDSNRTWLDKILTDIGHNYHENESELFNKLILENSNIKKLKNEFQKSMNFDAKF